MYRIEVLADSIAEYSGFSDPRNQLYRLRNPGRLKGYVARHTKDPHTGLRVFDSLIDGYRALLFDLEKKCSGSSNSGLTAESTLLELLYVYDFPDDTARYIIKFLRKALDNETLKADVPLSFFMEA